MASARASGLVFLGLARNCAPTLPVFFDLVDRVNRSGVTACAFVGENGSSDDTRAVLERARERIPLQVVDTGAAGACKGRFHRMAVARQMVLDALATQMVSGHAVCVLDLDDTLTPSLTPQALFEAMGKLEAEPFFARAATSRPFYYDLAAFEDERGGFTSVDFRATHLRSDPIAYYRFFSRFVYPNQEALTRDEPVRCLSAFNGLCVYRFADVLRASYVADNDFTECEHVWFHRSLGRLTGQPMVIDPSLVVAMPAEHGRRDFASFWLQRLVRLDRLLG